MAVSQLPTECGHVIFEDTNGQPRVDCTMLDPGASAFLMGSGPFHRYVDHLRELGYPVDSIEMQRTNRTFHFGGDHSTTSHWVAKIPMFINCAFGFAQAFIIKGETPMLMGRPIIEELGIVVNFKRRSMMFEGHPWRPITMGLHGEYLMSLTEDFDFELIGQMPAFDLTLMETQTPGDPQQVLDFLTYQKSEGIYTTTDADWAEGDRKIILKHWKTFENALATAENQINRMVTQELHDVQPRPRLIWEVYAGTSRVSEVASALGCEVCTFGYETGWDFDRASDRAALLHKLDEDMPDEILLAPRCALWSRMQAISATTSERQALLQEQRQLHHDIHLDFCRKIYLRQVRGGRHAHLEQPQTALSWHTKNLKSLPGFRTTFDMCQYGACCLDVDGVWRLTRKTTSLQTTKRAVAQALQLRCDGSHEHCRLEGKMPGSGRSRTSFMEDYQPTMAAVLAAALAAPEPPAFWEEAHAVNEEKLIQGQLIQLMTTNKAEAIRAVQRLHRNLGHPTTTALVEMLESRQASETVVNVARTFQCQACLKYKKPNQAAPASMKTVFRFNQSIQADTMWIKTGDNKIPVLSIVDEGTKFQGACVIDTEKAEHYIQSLERHWIAHFGTPQRLITDEGRGWLHDDFAAWTDSLNIQHVVAAGEAHERLSLVERRHAVLRKAVEVYLMDFGMSGASAVRQALAYVVPQMNNNPGTSGFSPAQWALGQSPSFPGELLGNNLNPVHLGATFEDELSRRAVAKMAIVQADTDQKLRRALLRRYAGTNVLLAPGQPCFYWRDARATDLEKIRWKGPATVLMREDDPESGKPRIYWIGHKSQLLRCAPHHVRPEIGRSASTLLGDFEVAKNVIQNLKSRGVTRYTDLTITNKRSLDDVDSDDEVLDDDDDLDGGPPPRQRRRLVDPEFPGSPAPSLSCEPSILNEEVPMPVDDEVGNDDNTAAGLPGLASDSPGLLSHGSPGLGASVGPEHTMDLGLSDPAPIGLEEPGPQQHPAIPLDTSMDVPISVGEPSREPSPTQANRPTTSDMPPPSSIPSSSQPQLDSITASYYQPTTAEDFRAHRRRLQQQETMSFGPFRSRRQASESAPPDSTHGEGPYTKPKEDDGASFVFSAFDVEDLDSSALPSGWKFENGYIQLTEQPKDYWEIKSGCLIRHHVVPRRTRFDPNKMSEKDKSHIPITLDKLDPTRVTVCTGPNEVRHYHDVIGDLSSATNKPWVGCTIFQINGATRQELGMTAYSVSSAKQVGKKQKVVAQRKIRKDNNKNDISERKLSLQDRLLFQQAKMKELASFFENGVWTFETTREADPNRTMSSRMLLKWAKQPDGSPRAKARLVVRGYTDADALAGRLDTASPASTRLGRACLLSISANLHWCGWSADVTTAFLQGLPQERKLWVKLPPDALRLLGGDENTRMLLIKPVYGQLDAPKRWYLEATRRLTSLGWTPHPLDPCLWRLFEPATEGECPVLCGLLTLHVDDMLGTGNLQSQTYMAAEAALKQAFSFRTWQKDEPFEYCGAKMYRDDDGTWHVDHQSYISKISPLPLEKSRQPHQPMSDREHTMLRQLLGSLQWPAVQSSPHLQASTSLLSGEMSSGLSSPLLEANRLLRFAKSNSDVHLRFPPLGDLKDLRITCMFDAALGVRHDGSSQGGFLILLTHKDAYAGVESPYHLLEWRSMRLPRVARSSLAAEVQSAAAAVDSTEFVVRFWQMMMDPRLTLRETLQITNTTLTPTFITDAKALYDSFHRDSINHGATDKRTNLELRVIREQVESVGGLLKWISSERQFGDGFTQVAARQLLSDRLRHGAIKFTFDPEYTASKKKTASQRARSRQEFSTTTTNTHHNTTHNLSTEAAEEGTHDDRPQWTESMDVDEIYGSVDEKHLCEEQRLLDDAHVSVDEATFVETFVPQNVLHSDLYDVSDPMHSPENVLASAESLDRANDLVTENANTFVNAQAPAETFVPVNVKAPVESFARASNVARPCLKYVMALSLLAGCAGDPLWPMVDKHHDWRDQCALGENSSATAHTGFHWIWVIFLFNLVFSVCCFCAALLMRRRWLEMDRARLELYRQNEYFRAEIRKLRNEIIDVDWQRQDLQLKVLDHDRIRSEEREEDQRVVRKASGLLDRILVELEILTGFFIYTTPRGECWHSSDRCTHLRNSERVRRRSSCSGCHHDFLPPWTRHPDSGTTFFEDCAAFFHQHGRWDYMQTVIE